MNCSFKRVQVQLKRCLAQKDKSKWVKGAEIVKVNLLFLGKLLTFHGLSVLGGSSTSPSTSLADTQVS